MYVPTSLIPFQDTLIELAKAKSSFYLDKARNELYSKHPNLGIYPSNDRALAGERRCTGVAGLAGLTEGQDKTGRAEARCAELAWSIETLLAPE